MNKLKNYNMAKDPAFLFYSNDFLSGTYTMTDEQVGKYIRLLCLQHQKERLNEKDMLMICKSYDKDIYDKFENEDGSFFNKRLVEESNKRKKYSESRSYNRKKKDMSIICKSYEHHMENENENVNEIKDIIIKGKKYEFNDIVNLPSNYITSIQEQMFTLQKKRLEETKIISLWEAFRLEKLTGDKFYNSDKEVFKHFVNWIKTQKFDNGIDKKGLSYESDQRIAASVEYANRYRESNK